jgi:hypothetical protein
MKPIRGNRIALSLVVLALFWLASCSSDDPVDAGGGGGNGTADEEFIAGVADLESELFAMINTGNIESPGDMDFTAAHDHFAEAVRKSPLNKQARFGLSLTTLLALTSDSEINAAFDEWEQYLADNTPFKGSGNALSPLGVPLTFASGNRTLELPLEILAPSLMVGLQPGLKAVEPNISRVQDIFRDRVIPALELSASHLGEVAEDPDFVFWVTPMMQGDAAEDSLELDRTEILAARAGVLLLTSACRMAVAYDLSFPSYDAAGILSALDYDAGNMLALRSDGIEQMAGVETDFLAAVNALDAGITSLLGETDSQDNDIIKIGPDLASRTELVDFQNTDLPKARDIFASGLVLNEDWDSDYLTPNVDLRINAHNFFSNPITDWKQVFPPYTVSTREVSDAWIPRDYINNWNGFNSTTAGSAEGGCVFWVENSYVVRDSTWGHPELSQFARMVGGWELEYLMYYGYIYAGTLTVAGAGDLVVGYNYIDLFMDFELVTDAPTTVIPHLTWEADTFQEWKSGLDNPNFNGLLPEINTIDQLFTLFGYDGDGWEKEFDIDWTDLD